MCMEARYEWWRGIITTEIIDGKKIATKSAKDNTKVWAINKEIQILHYLQEQWIDFVPQIIDSWDGWFSYEWREGEHFKTEMRNQKWELRKKLIVQLLERAYQLDNVGVVHGEFIRPFTNILVWSQMKSMKSDEEKKLIEDENDLENIIYVIDFERGKMGDFSGKNMRSFSQRLLAEWYLSLEECKRVGKMEREEIYQFLHNKLIMNNEQWTTNFWSFALGSVFLGLLFLDQVTKYLFYDLKRGEVYWLLTPAFNTGIGWSIPIPLWFVHILTILVIFVVIRAWRKKYLWSWITVFLLSGALWNLVDRLFLWWVRDFIDLHYRPIFNVADMYLSIAAILLIIYTFTSEKKNV